MTILSAGRATRKLEAAEGYLMLGMAERAIRELRRMDETNLRGFDWHCLMAEANRQLDQFDMALREYETAAAHRPGDARVLSGMAWCFKRTDQLQRAIAVAEEAYQADPEQAVLLYNIACYYCLAKNKSQTLSWLGRALRMDSSLCRLINGESDFDSLREDSDFQFIVSAAGGNGD